VLKPNGDKGHDGKEDGEDLSNGLTSCKSHPDGKADEPVAANSSPKGLAESKIDFVISNLHGRHTQGSIRGLPKPGVVKRRVTRIDPMKLATKTIPISLSSFQR
jgi:hypothetical protein